MIWEHFTRKKEDRWFKTSKDLFMYLPTRKVKNITTTQTTQESLDDSTKQKNSAE